MVVEAQCVRTRWGVYRTEKLIGSQHRHFTAINPGVPIRIVPVEQDNVSRLGKIGR